MRRLLLTAAAALLACSGGASPDPDVPVDVDRVVIDLRDAPVVVLEERDGPRILPIWIGPAEATSIAMQLSATSPPRPNTHDMATRLVDALDGRVEAVVVSALEAGTYYGLVRLRTPRGRVEIDVRPSDGIALALRTGAPLFVRESVFEASDAPPEAEPEAPDAGRGDPDGRLPATGGRKV